MAAGSKTGRAGYFTLNSVVIPITKWTTKGTKELADATDSSLWDVASGELYKAQAPGVLSLEVSVEGYWDSNTTGTGIIAKLKSDPTLPVTLQYDRSTNAFSGNFDLADVNISLTVPGATMIGFTCTLRSNGVFTTY